MKLQNKTRRVAGIGILLLAVLGLLLCLGGTAGAWFIKSRVGAVGDAVFGTADVAFGFVEEKLELVKRGLEGSRESAEKLSRIATRLRIEETDVRQECELLLQFLDTSHQHWQAAGSWLDSAEVLASGVGRVTEALVSSDFVASRQDSTGVAAARDVQAYADSVADVLAKVQSMRGELIERRDSGALAREAVLALADRVIELERAMDQLAVGLEKVAAKVAAARTASAEQGRRFHRWTLAATLVASLLPVWFGISQTVMMAHGWRMAHSSAESIQPC
jgi:uncharacterized protein YukE